MRGGEGAKGNGGQKKTERRERVEGRERRKSVEGVLKSRKPVGGERYLVRSRTPTTWRADSSVRAKLAAGEPKGGSSVSVVPGTYPCVRGG